MNMQRALLMRSFIPEIFQIFKSDIADPTVDLVT